LLLSIRRMGAGNTKARSSKRLEPKISRGHGDILSRAMEGDASAQFEIGKMYESGSNGKKQSFHEAIEWYKIAAKEGSVPALKKLGFMLQNGKGENQDFAKAFDYFEMAAQKGDAESCRIAGLCLLNGQGRPRDPVRAIPLLQQAAEKQDMIAMESLGDCYLEGKGVPKHFVMASGWFDKAVQLGSTAAKRKLGWMIGQGLGSPQRRDNEIDILKAAADTGDVAAQLKVGRRLLKVEGHVKEAMGWFEKAAARGNADAQVEVAKILLHNGVEGLQSDKVATAKRLLSAAAENGSEEACFHLGWLYSREPGRGKLALGWMTKAADLGVPDAMFSVGCNLQHGKGVDVNKARAAEYFRGAIEGGHSLSNLALASLVFEGMNVGITIEKASSMVKDVEETARQLSSGGDLDARRLLALGYLHGDKYIRNEKEGLQLLESAANDGCAISCRILSEMYTKGEKVEKDLRKAVDYDGMAEMLQL